MATNIYHVLRIKKRLNVAFLFSILLLFASSCNLETAKGSFEIIENFPSEWVQNRTIQLYLPSSYHSTSRNYPVLYLQDGQMLFDASTTWNGQEWGVDEVMDSLIHNNMINETIVVGVWNGGPNLRHPEYFPQKPFESLSELTQDSLYSIKRSPNQLLFSEKVQSDNYLKFLTSELKPFIDSVYRTKADFQNTFIGGSSMGGLISVYALCEYPTIFSGAICMSTHWPGTFSAENNPIPNAFYKYLEGSLPSTGEHKLYFDYGTETLDALYEPFQNAVDSIMKQKSYSSANWKTIKFEGHAHDEMSWNSRLDIPLSFMLKQK